MSESLEKTKLEDMQVGDSIACRYTASGNTIGKFSELGTCVASEIPYTGAASPNGLFYFIKVDKGTLIADRVIHNTVAWSTLNSGKYIQGKSITLGVAGCNIYTNVTDVTYADGCFSVQELGGTWQGGMVSIDMDEIPTFSDTDVVTVTYTDWCNSYNTNGGGQTHFQVVEKSHNKDRWLYSYCTAPAFEYGLQVADAVWSYERGWMPGRL